MPTLSDFERARTERLWDGVSLWCDRRSQGGIYLVGYHAEITLKMAYFRWKGFLSHQVIDFPQMNLARANAKRLGIITPRESYHIHHINKAMVAANWIDLNYPRLFS
jgi:hypothetical protein